MKNIFSYIKKYGDVTFSEMEFNDVDNLVFSSISYVDYDIKEISKKGDLLLEDIALHYFDNHSKAEMSNNILAVRQSIKILKAIMSTKRYKNLRICNYKYVADSDTQFCAMCIKLPNNTVYVSFEGTDQLISGWKENFEMSYTFPVKAQKMAINYLNRYMNSSYKSIILGGHSKGGNLAIVSAMYTHFWIRARIIKIYNNDGPGLRKKQIESRNYKKIENRLVHIIPNYSFVGLLLRHSENYRVIYSYESGFLAHDLCSWKVEDKDFVDTKLSFMSKELDRAFTNWLDSYNDHQRKFFVDSLFDVCVRAGIDDLLDIKNDKFDNILKIIKETKNIDKETKEMIGNFFKFLIKYFSFDLKKMIGRN